MQFVTIEMTDKTRSIQHRPRPARRHLIDDAKRLAAFVAVGSDHDRNVMIGQRQWQVDARNDIERLQLDAGFFQQELDRRIAAHVDCGREREHAQSRRLGRAWRAKQLMEAEHFRLNGQARRFFAEQLRNQREIEPLARTGRSADHFRNQFVAQRTQIDTVERHRGQFGKSDSVRAERLGFGLIRIGQHMKTPDMTCKGDDRAAAADAARRSVPARNQAAFAARAGALAAAANCEETSP